MQTLGLDNETEFTTDKEYTGSADSSDTIYTAFWKRQFGKEATTKQRYYDWIFGVVMPVICFAFDPFVFKSSNGAAFLGALKPFAYLLSYVSVMAMMAWLLFGARLKWLNALLAGLFTVGGTISLLVGIFLFPFSLLGLLIFIGALGFTPLFTSIIYLRSAARAYRAARPFIEKRVLLPTFLLTGLFSVVIPATINMEIHREFNRMLYGDAAAIREGAASLKYVRPLLDPGPLATTFYRIRDPKLESEREQALVAAYRELSGEELKDMRRVYGAD
jgi:hypothetical protein